MYDNYDIHVPILCMWHSSVSTNPPPIPPPPPPPLSLSLWIQCPLRLTSSSRCPSTTFSTWTSPPLIGHEETSSNAVSTKRATTPPSSSSVVLSTGIDAHCTSSGSLRSLGDGGMMPIWIVQWRTLWKQTGRQPQPLPLPNGRSFVSQTLLELLSAGPLWLPHPSVQLCCHVPLGARGGHVQLWVGPVPAKDTACAHTGWVCCICVLTLGQESGDFVCYIALSIVQCTGCSTTC